MRSFLTTLGVIIGVSAVIAMVAIGEGAKARVAEAFASMGSNILIVLSGSTTSGGSRGRLWQHAHPDLGGSRRPSARNAAPSATRSPQLRTNASVISEDQNWTTSVNGVSPEYFPIRDWPVARGSALSAVGHRGRHQGGRAGADRGRQALRRQRGSGRANRPHQELPFPGRRACWRARANRRWGRTTTMPCSCRTPRSRRRSRAACRSS